jgi:hypothetical protein
MVCCIFQFSPFAALEPHHINMMWRNMMDTTWFLVYIEKPDFQVAIYYNTAADNVL